MDYINCKDLPLWAQILLHPVGGEHSEREDEVGESDPPEYPETATAA